MEFDLPETIQLLGNGNDGKSLLPHSSFQGEHISGGWGEVEFHERGSPLS